ncbi:alkaline ceramidase 2 [Lingula anatina]|uniref:Alkaline ceramidase n=1 Tax=Lingula anatina TaxID=7574 RepID=A0A1S3H206_LINAN|nr:alkaline ceramidase 2 [Lingula anatina]|eukprot:XP_013379174.1 alkaline ceramidase 2 [Lingula anatina]
MHEFQRGSSDVDWCEANYDITSFIAEFFNTISNALFIVGPPLLIYLFRHYARLVTWEVNIVWGLLVIVGLGSAYFHATLSLVGQLLDEIAILWVLMAALGMWFPKRLLPLVFQHSRRNFKVALMCFTALSSGLACVMPEVNAFVLMLFGIPATMLLCTELWRTQCRRVRSLGIRCGVLWLLAVTCWINDRVFCDVWSSLHFPYLHCAWHILIFIASYTACVLFAYFDVVEEIPEQMPVLKYWPKNHWDFWGVPYITLLKPVTKIKHSSI